MAIFLPNGYLLLEDYNGGPGGAGMKPPIRRLLATFLGPINQ